MKKVLRNGVCLAVMAILMSGFYACSEDAVALSDDASVSLKSTTVGATSTMYVYRNPEPAAIGAYALKGINLTTDDQDSMTSVTTGSGSYQLYFYNERIFQSTDTTYLQGKGCPVLVMGSGVSAYKTSVSGYENFGELTADSIPDDSKFASDITATLPLPDVATYRYTSGILDGALKRSIKSGYYRYDDNFVIGNYIQNTVDSTQPVYIVKIYDEELYVYYYYSFMISKFKNGTAHTNNPATDMYSMTIKYCLLKEESL